jgi:pimeloyl-ACP methyl ester carboxylesterase
MYIEECGAGEAVLLLHGGLETADSLPILTEALASEYHVIAPERRGHGRTPDVAGPITYEMMAADTLAVMDALDVHRAHIVGSSDGANIAMLIAMAHPECVRRLVLVSGNFHADGMTAAFGEELRSASANTYEARFREAYERLSPDGAEHWQIVFEKVRRMWLEEPALTAADLVRIQSPTLVLAGDGDFVRPEHTAAMADAIPGARLLVPRNANGLLSEQPVLDLITKFLRG